MGEIEHRILSRSLAIQIVSIVLVAAVAAVWAGMLWIESYGDDMAILQALSPDDAATKLARDLRTFAVGMLAVLLAASALVAWYGSRALRSGVMPPAGAWIVQGQRIRKGRDATLAAWVLISGAGVLALLAIVSTLLLWNVAATVAV